ncbi:MAG: hypothetical protein VYC27_01605 [Candidatus Thermoplasmatota archaeon]|nr:hypothetical protein [Candidatus Thermoplasmatota archaeon]MEE2666321.1 hypothetical protein [Candidatus Thermoplasmatota archaeon]
MVPNVGWSRSRRWLLETCARRYVLTYPGENGRTGQPAAPTPRLRLKRLIDGVRKDLFEDRSEGHAWSNRLHRVVLERRMMAAGEALDLDAVGRRREARREVFKMNLLFRHPWMEHHLPLGAPCSVPSPLRSVDDTCGPLWAAPQAVVGGRRSRVMLLRRGRHRAAVDDLEAAISRRWTMHSRSEPVDKTVTVMRWVASSWLHRVVLVTPELEAASEALIAHDRRAMAGLHRRWQRHGLASLPLAESSVHCRRCPFLETCPVEVDGAGSSHAPRAPSTRS